MSEAGRDEASSKGGASGKAGSTGKGGTAGKGGAKSEGTDAGAAGADPIGAAGEGGGPGEGGAAGFPATAGQAGVGGASGGAGGSAPGASGAGAGVAGASAGTGGLAGTSGSAGNGDGGSTAGGAAGGAGGGGASAGNGGTGAGNGGSANGGTAGATAGSAGKGGAIVSPPQETSIALCTDGKDNDADGLVDCRDPGCKTVPSCDESTNETCSDGKDNDGDGYIDCDDFDCSKNPAVTVCGKGDGTCSDNWEPNNSPGQLGAIEIDDWSAEFCFEQTICQKDTDWIDFAFIGTDYGGKVSLTITLLSPPNGSTVIVRATDPDNAQAPIETTLTAQGATKSLALPVPLDCSAGFCVDQKRRVKVIAGAGTPLTYRLCGELK